MNLQQQALISFIASEAPLTQEMRQQLADELHKHYQIAEAWEIWQEKTEWVQKTAQPGELGMHRADVLKARNEKLEKWKAEHEAATLSLQEMKLLVQWFTTVQDVHPLFLRAEDSKLAAKIKHHIKKAKT